MTLAEQFIKEVEFNESKGNLGLDLFYETLLKYKGRRYKTDFEFEDGSQLYYDSINFKWILS